MMSSPRGEAPLWTQDRLPHLGDVPLTEQRDHLHDIYVRESLIDPTDISFMTDSPMTDIQNMRYAALTPYVEAVKSRMRNGAITQMTVSGDSISASELFDTVHTADGQERPTLLVRRINRSRLELARQSGTDRDGGSSPGGKQYEYERQARKEYGISSPRDITYAGLIRLTSSDIRVNTYDALLVYAPEALQPIIPRCKDFSEIAVHGLFAFVDQRLVRSSLLATVGRSGPSPQPTALGEIAFGQGLTPVL